MNILPKKYYLDKNFYPLRNKILEKLAKSGNYKNINHLVLEDIITDTLLAIKPSFKQANQPTKTERKLVQEAGKVFNEFLKTQ